MTSRRHGLISLPTYLALLLCCALLSGCGSSGSSKEREPEQENSALPVETRLHTALENVDSDVDFTLILEANNGAQFIHRHGASSEHSVYESASTSKMVSAAVILKLVDDGLLSLDDNPQDYIVFWPDDESNHAQITLHHLLSFTSGLNASPNCVTYGIIAIPFADCVENVLDENNSIPAPGSEYYYSGTHLHVAGLMAIESSEAFDDWHDVFDYFKSETGLFSTAVFDLPNTSNPRLAGGMHWNGLEYIEFLSALYRGNVLMADTFAAMASDQIDASTIVYSPVEEGPLEYDWHYGYGLWIECAGIPFDCEGVTRISSAGAYGAYPFIDFEYAYVGLLARQGSLSTGHEGFAAFQQVKALADEWAAENFE